MLFSIYNLCLLFLQDESLDSLNERGIILMFSIRFMENVSGLLLEEVSKFSQWG